jgi:hypothetical protein
MLAMDDAALRERVAAFMAEERDRVLGERLE